MSIYVSSFGFRLGRGGRRGYMTYSRIYLRARIYGFRFRDSLCGSSDVCVVCYVFFILFMFYSVVFISTNKTTNKIELTGRLKDARGRVARWSSSRPAQPHALPLALTPLRRAQAKHAAIVPRSERVRRPRLCIIRALEDTRSDLMFKYRFTLLCLVLSVLVVHVPVRPDEKRKVSCPSSTGWKRSTHVPV